MTKPFLPDDFLLSTDAARLLYWEHAADQPIFDYHCHLPVEQVAANCRFENLTSLWLAGDHYKWRAMRANGIPERLITGKDTSDYEKFLAFARTAPKTLRNPLYHWSHLELRRYFDIDLLINEENAPEIWAHANARLAEPGFSTHGILARSRVAAVCTTDDPIDSLEHHAAIRRSDLGTRVYPTFRPDKALLVDKPGVFNAWCDRLAERAGVEANSLATLLEALDRRHAFFHSLGGRLSDHGMEFMPLTSCTEAEAKAIFDRARSGTAATPDEAAKFTVFMMLFFGRLDAARGWTKQLHLGALRDNNTRMLRTAGDAVGTDSIGDFAHARGLSRYLDQLDSEDKLPRVVIYNLNPADNYVFATMAGNFQDGITPGKIQFGSGWWFLDQKEGMEWQMNALSQLGLLSRFVGMLTDSRSFVSYVRHEYFRRILCSMLGADIEAGLIPGDIHLVGGMVEDICYRNAVSYFGLEPGAVSASPFAERPVRAGGVEAMAIKR